MRTPAARVAIQIVASLTQARPKTRTAGGSRTRHETCSGDSHAGVTRHRVCVLLPRARRRLRVAAIAAPDDEDDEEARPRPVEPQKADTSKPNGDGDDDGTGTPSAPTPPGAKKVGSALVVDLGAVTSGATVDLDVPASALGFNVTVESTSGTIGIQKIAAPNAMIVHDAFTPKNGSLPIGEGYLGLASVSVPQNDLSATMPLAKGKWKVTFGGSGSGARATARIQTSKDGKFYGGKLDLDVHLPQGLRVSAPSATHVVNAASAPTDPDIKARIDTFYFALNRAFGIGRGAVRFHDAPATLRTITTDAAIDAASAISKGKPDVQGLHLVLTNALTVEGGELLGLSPGIPGAPMRSGSLMSAIMVSIYPGEADVFTDALTILHEMGHFVGLNHTSEYDGTEFDPLSDTPKCPRQRQASTRCPDEGNLMFTGAFANPPILSNAQKNVFRASPVYQAFATGTAAAMMRADASEPELDEATVAMFASRAPLASTRRLCGHGLRRVR